MLIEDTLPDYFKRAAYHPSLFVYAWKRKDIDKLFEEFLKSNIAITSGEVWTLEDEEIVSVIPLKTGDKDIFNWKVTSEKKENFYDFVERSIKVATENIANWDLEKNVRLDLRQKVFYHFNLKNED